MFTLQIFVWFLFSEPLNVSCLLSPPFFSNVLKRSCSPRLLRKECLKARKAILFFCLFSNKVIIWSMWESVVFCFFFVCVCLVIFSVFMHLASDVSSETASKKTCIVNYKPWFKLKQTQISGPPGVSTHFQRLSRGLELEIPRSVCTSSKLAMTNPSSLEPKVVLKQHPCRQSSGGAAAGFLFVDFSWGRLDVRETPQRDTWKVFFLLEHFSFELPIFVKMNSFELHGIVAVAFLISLVTHLPRCRRWVSTVPGRFENGRAKIVGVQQSRPPTKEQLKIQVKYPQFTMDIRPCFGGPLTQPFIARKGPLPWIPCIVSTFFRKDEFVFCRVGVWQKFGNFGSLTRLWVVNWFIISWCGILRSWSDVMPDLPCGFCKIPFLVLKTLCMCFC